MVRMELRQYVTNALLTEKHSLKNIMQIMLKEYQGSVD